MADYNSSYSGAQIDAAIGKANSAVQPGEDAASLGSNVATDGHVLTADGLGGAAWEAAPGASSMDSATYDPQAIAGDAFARANHTGTQLLATISDAGTAAALDVPSTGNAAIGEVVKGDDTRLTDNRDPNAHSHAASEVTSGTFADARIAQSNVTQHQAALSLTESQISDLQSYLTSVAIGDITDWPIGLSAIELGYVNGVTSGIQGQLNNKAAASHTHTLSDITDAGTAAAAATGDFATAAQGALAASALQSSDIGVSVQGYSAALNGTTASFTTALETKLNGIEASADVTDTANVTAAGALMDSEVANLAAVKAFNPADYATAVQGSAADTALQPGDDADALGSGVATDGHVLTADGLGGAAWEAVPAGGSVEVLSNVATSTIIGRVTGGSGDSEELTATQVRTLIGVEAGATADQTGAEIKAAYEAEANTNAFTDALLSKLNGIEASADVTDATNVTAAGAVMLTGNQTLTGGFDSDVEALGTASGTVTPEVDGANKENFKSLTNNGAFTLAPPSTSSDCTIRIHLTNGASAGAITTSGFDRVIDNDTYATTNAKEYWFIIDHNATRDTLTIVEIV